MGTRGIQERLGVPRSAVNAWYEQRPPIVGAPFLPTHVCGFGELFCVSLFRTGIGEEYLWAPLLTLVHDARILEFFDKCFLSPECHIHFSDVQII